MQTYSVSTSSTESVSFWSVKNSELTVKKTTMPAIIGSM